MTILHVKRSSVLFYFIFWLFTVAKMLHAGVVLVVKFVRRINEDTRFLFFKKKGKTSIN